MKHLKIILICILTLILQRCISWSPSPPIYKNIKSKNFKNESYLLKASDTLWLLTPRAIIRRKSLYDEGVDNTGLTEDLDGEAKMKACVAPWFKKRLEKHINVKEVQLDDSTSTLIDNEASTMFDYLHNTSVETYRLKKDIREKLLKNNINKLNLTSIYWEYFDEALERKLTEISIAGHYVIYPQNVTIIIQNVIYDTHMNEAISCKTILIRLNDRSSVGPFGYYGHYPKFNRRHSAGVERLFNPIIRDIRKKIKTEL